LPDRLKPIAPDAGYIIAVGHDYANTKKITDLQSKIPENAGLPIGGNQLCNGCALVSIARWMYSCD